MSWLKVLLTIAQFTPWIQNLIHTIETDAGRPVAEMNDAQLLAALASVDIGSFAASAAQGEADARAGLPPNPNPNPNPNPSPRPTSMPSTTSSAPTK